VLINQIKKLKILLIQTIKIFNGFTFVFINEF
jgi:hypothetical protein